VAKKKKNLVFRLDEIVEQVEQEQTEAEQMAEVKQMLKDKRKDYKVKRLSKYKYVF